MDLACILRYLDPMAIYYPDNNRPDLALVQGRWACLEHPEIVPLIEVERWRETMDKKTFMKALKWAKKEGKRSALVREQRERVWRTEFVRRLTS
jgi:hypothetical protein